MAYRQTSDWTWEFYPPPYNFLAPGGGHGPAAPVLYTPAAGLGGCGCGCNGHGSCGGGLGLFESGFDWTQWSVGEWTVAAVGSYLAVSLFSDMARAGHKVRRSLRRRQRVLEA
jgi:hypothetical protein